MMNENVINLIPLEIAIQLCAEIREEIDRIWYPTPARWCFYCQEETGGDGHPPAAIGWRRAGNDRIWV